MTLLSAMGVLLGLVSLLGLVVGVVGLLGWTHDRDNDTKLLLARSGLGSGLVGLVLGCAMVVAS